MMFPRFDKLIDSENSNLADSLSRAGFDDAGAAASQLKKICQTWLSVRPIRKALESRQGEINISSDDRFAGTPIKDTNGLPTPDGAGRPDCDDSRTGLVDQNPGWFDSLQRVLGEAPLPDTVLNVVEQYVRNAIEHFDPFALFENTPRSLDILARIACGSPFLTQTLLADPICLTSLTSRGRTAEIKSREQFIAEAEAPALASNNRNERLRELRRYQRRELLRIGMCDAFGLLDLRFVTLQLSLLADAMVQVSLNLAAHESGVPADSLVIVALGKHGGEELNYSSDIDLLLIGSNDAPEVQRLARLTIDGLAENMPPGFLYRVDLRLRPWGDAGPLVSTIDAYAAYLKNDAALWEKQALLKARAVAGNPQTGRDFLAGIRPLLFLESAHNIRTSIQQMKERIESRLKQRGKLNSEVKLGIGSIRDIEFLVQCLQLTYGGTEPRILSFNTLDSLVRLAEFDFLTASWYRQLRAGYVFLRTVEHSLQLLHNQQTHELPSDPRQREWLANRLDYPSADTLLARFDEHRASVRKIFEACLFSTTYDQSLNRDASTGGRQRQTRQADETDTNANRRLVEMSQSATTIQPTPQKALVGALSAEQLRINRRISAEVQAGADVVVHCRPGCHPSQLAPQEALSDVRRQNSRSLPADQTLLTTEQPEALSDHSRAEDAPGLADEPPLWHLTFCAELFNGWLSVITGLLAVYRLNIVRGTTVLAYPGSEHDPGCLPNQFLAMFTVSRDHAGGSRDHAGGSRDHADGSRDHADGTRGHADFTRGRAEANENAIANGSEQADQLAGLLRDQLASCIHRIRADGIDDVRDELIARFCSTMQAASQANAQRMRGKAVVVQPADIRSSTGSSPTVNPALTPMQIEVLQNPDTGDTGLHVSGADTPGFLFEMSHALSISRFRVIVGSVESIGDQVRDVLYVTEQDGRPVDCEDRMQELRVTIALIKQFTHWLPATSDPHQALLRFRELLTRLQPASHWNRDVESLQRPDVLYAVARVLGISQFLWEDFLRSRYEELFPLLANTEELKDRISRARLQNELAETVDRATRDKQGPASLAAAWKAVNAFKDRHLFRIDMRHVLGHCRPFGVFSEEITELAELVVIKAVELAGRQLRADFGDPTVSAASDDTAQNSAPPNHTGRSTATTRFDAAVQPCGFVVAGLGKCGGIEMGYASDIELMLIYEADGQTNGRQSVSNARYFELLVGAVSSGISARQDGIFNIDLRMRPYGQAGSAAVTLQAFSAYYGPDGPSWPYERQGLVKFRCLTGSSQFARTVTDACHAAVYSAGTFEFAAMRAMRERQIRQLVRGGTINAKLSDGGLVDLEYAVQAMQITFGNRMPALRHSNTLTALRSASQLGLIDPQQAGRIEEAYVFLRELIDCMRMVRGNAKDLTLPEPGSSDYQQLARRMQSIHDSVWSLDQLEQQMQIVRDFSQTVEQHCRSMRINQNV